MSIPKMITQKEALDTIDEALLTAILMHINEKMSTATFVKDMRCGDEVSYWSFPFTGRINKTTTDRLKDLAKAAGWGNVNIRISKEPDRPDGFLIDLYETVAPPVPGTDLGTWQP